MTIDRPGILFLVWLSVSWLAAGCATAPRVADVVHDPPAREPVQILSAEGLLSPEKSQALMERLKRSVGPTDMLERYNAVMEAVSGSPLTAGNKVTLLIDGPATYDAMFKAIRGARDSVNFETYIFEDDEVGRRFADALIRQQAAGAQVNVIYDAVGSVNTPAAFFARMRGAGIQVREFNPINPAKKRGKPWLIGKRDHRKILVVDGRIAFTGGVNISDVYSSSPSGRSSEEDGGKRPGRSWRDTHVMIEGPAAAEFQKLFLDSWARQKGPPSKRNDFPPPTREGKDLVRVVGSTPGPENRLTYLMYAAAFSYAENYIHLTTSYFSPDEQTIKALIRAAQRGVDVRIILPGASDSRALLYAGRSFYTRLLESGVKLYERRPDSMLHAKTAVIDNIWSTVGSTNMELMSFRNNDEVNAIVLGRDFAARMEAMFQDDLAESTQILPEAWKKRPLKERVKAWLAGLFRSWL